MAIIKRVYCQFEFLLAWLNAKPNVQVSREESIQEAKNWLSIGQLLNRCDLCLDISADECENIIKAREDGWQYLSFRNTVRGRGLHYSNKVQFPTLTSDVPFSNSKEANAYYLTMLPDDKCKDLSSKYATLILNLKLLLQSNVFVDNGLPIPSVDYTGWDFLDSVQDYLLCSCNSIIIIDNYLVKCLDDCFESNIKPIICHLTNKLQNHSQRIDILVFTCTEFIEKGGVTKSYKHNCLRLVEMMKELQDDRLHCKVYKTSNQDFHDRVIITNNLWFSCGKGFTVPLFSEDEKARSSSVSLLFPYIQTATKWCDGAYSNVMRDISKVLNKGYTLDFNMWGDDDIKGVLLEHFLDEVKAEYNREHPGIKMEDKTIEEGGLKLNIKGTIDLSQFNKGRKRFNR